jgi:6-phosphogluconate dehydrogenase
MIGQALEEPMQIGMIGLGRMGSGMVRRLMRDGHECVVADRDAAAVAALAREKAVGSASLQDLVVKLRAPRSVWLMVPAAAVDATVRELAPQLSTGDVIVDGGNSHYIDDIRRAKELHARGIAYVDVGTSGGVWGLERGFCLMIGGTDEAVARLDPVFKSLSPGRGDIPRTPGREKSESTAELGYLHCGAPGAGHFVKMVHNGIEYGLMAAYAEGLNILRHADAGKRERAGDAETTPLRHPEHYQYDFNLTDVAELWRRGSVIASWLLDLTAAALLEKPDLSGLAGRVSDSGEGRWTLLAAIEEGAPAPVLNAALAQRFASRGNDEFARKLLSAMRLGFGGHREPGAGS